jgi:hypothetical protein
MAMSGFEDISVQNQEAIEEIARTIRWSEGQFALVLARCNYGELRDRAIDRLRIEFPGIVVLEVPQGAVSLLDWLREAIGGRACSAAMVVGLEGVTDLPGFLSTANQIREAFREDCPFPLVLWATDSLMESLTRFAPDFESWGTTTRFEISSAEIEKWLGRRVDEWFSGELVRSFPSQAKWSEVEREFLDAIRIQNHDTLPEKTRLGWSAALGSIYHEQWKVDHSIAYYQQALQNWEESIWKIGRIKATQELVNNYYIKARSQPNRNHPDWNLLREATNDLVRHCNEGYLEHLVNETPNVLGNVLASLEQWEILKLLAQEVLNRLAGSYRNLISAKANRFLAEVALSEKDWDGAMNHANQSLSQLETIKLSDDFNQPLLEKNLNILHPIVRNLEPLCHTFIARAKEGLGDIDGSILSFEDAQASLVGIKYYDQHLDILNNLERLYRSQNNHLKAFETKQERFSVEQQMGIRAFIGAGWLKPEQDRKLNFSTLGTDLGEDKVATAIRSSGRSQDIKKLIDRIGGTEDKLTILHGASGVGKSSLMTAGLVPALLEKAIGTRNNCPVLIRQYTKWEESILETLVEHPSDSNLMDQIFQQLERNESNLQRTILIFDQFEEFFFVKIDRPSRQPFYNFLGRVIGLSNIKVILSMREDYLHYLLECRKTKGIEQINGGDVLGRSVLYEIGNFSPEDARSIIEDLTTRSQFILEPALIDHIVSDLSEPFGEVRPIELQIVGAQLQSEGIQTLAAYPKGGKSALVDDYLMSVVKDCGPENEQLATWVAYLLTDERGTRPFKTRSEIERELKKILPSAESVNFDLVLAVLVGSGLVLRSKEREDERYQLVHDYLAGVIHERQKPRFNQLAKELEQEKEKRKKLEQVLKHSRYELASLQIEVTKASQGKKNLEKDIEELSRKKKDLESQVSTHNNHLTVWAEEHKNEVKNIKEKYRLLKERMFNLEDFYLKTKTLASKSYYTNAELRGLVEENNNKDFDLDNRQRINQLAVDLMTNWKTLSNDEFQISRRNQRISKTDSNQKDSFWRNLSAIAINVTLACIFIFVLKRTMDSALTVPSLSFFLAGLTFLIGSYLLYPKQPKRRKSILKKR